MSFRAHAAGLEGMVGTLAVAGAAASQAVRHGQEMSLADRDIGRLRDWVRYYASRADAAENELARVRAELAAVRRERDDAMEAIEALA